MFRRPKFIPPLAVREWLALLCGGAVFGLLLAWLQKSLGLDARIVRLVLLIVAVVLLCLSARLLVAYARELRREQDEWAGCDEEEDDGGRGTRPTL